MLVAAPAASESTSSMKMKYDLCFTSARRSDFCLLQHTFIQETFVVFIDEKGRKNTQSETLHFQPYCQSLMFIFKT